MMGILQRMCSTGAVWLVSLAAFAWAPAPANAVSDVNTSSGVAIHGYDPVAYFTQGKPVEGSGEHQHEWRGAEWRFSSRQNKELFAQNPEKYAPQYGGYCAYAVSQGVTADIDPEAWSIYQEKLYLNLNPAVQAIWSEDIPGYIAEADKNWPGLRGE